MKYPFKYISTFCFTFAMTGCTEIGLECDDNKSDTKTPIQLSAAYPTLTRASDAGFENGDNMGVYVMDYSDGQPQDMSSQDIHASNVKFRFNALDNTWIGATDIYWTSNDTPSDIIGYYPFISNIENPESVPFSISREQDDVGSESVIGGYEASDFLWAKASKVMPTSSKVNMTFNHIMSGVKVILQPADGFSQTEWESLEKTVLVSNIVPTANINLENGTITPKDEIPISIKPYYNNGEWRAVVVPQTISAGNVISITVDGINYSLQKSEPLTYVQGKMHTFTISVKRKQDNGQYEFSLIDESITPWLDDVDFRDGIMRDYVVVNIPEKGTLAEQISELGLNPENIINLKLKGEVDENDFGYIREHFDYIKAINLKDVEVYSDGEKDVLPPNAFASKATLNHVIFPKNLKIIGSCAFIDSGLIGDLIIPEGVTHIGTNIDEAIPGHWNGGWGVFTNCLSLVGSLSLPSTLEFIECCAFCRAPLSGELIIPDNVKFIGSCAFDSSKFTGTLSLPENLEEIGNGAFYGVPLTGDLTIPQGIRQIKEFTFTNGKYSLLYLPEGIVEIDDQAFDGCTFRGELQLPSTLKRIGNRAFSNNYFSSIVFPENLVYMGNECFSENSRLIGSLELPNKLTAINHGSFSGCTLLEEVIFGENITKIEGEAFGYCYNLTSVVVTNPEPPLLTTNLWGGWESRDAFFGVPKDNFTLQVPGKSIDLYQQANGWKEFKRIAAYSNFVCRPATACALNTHHEESIILNSDGAWEITHKPEWCSISKMSGNGKTELTLTINEMSKGSGNRTDYVEFSLKGTEFTTRCELSQYDYQYDEDQCITLQTHTKGSGIDVLFVGDGFDGDAISKGNYLELVKEQMEYFFAIEPYSSYRDYFNVYSCISLSQETGVNTANTWRNTRFMTQYYNSSLQLNDIDMVFDYAVDKSPITKERLPQSVIIMSLNSDEYGGTTILTWNGSGISICPKSSDPYPMDTRGIVQHEACGHNFGKLGEERILKNIYVDSKQRSQIEEMHGMGWFQNLSLSGKLNDVPWSHFIFDPKYSDKVDVFEGGYTVARGVFRAEINSCMNQGIPYFNAISRQDIMRRILEYSGEGFTMEKFYAIDSDKWGSTGNSTRAAIPSEADAYVNSGLHHPVRIVKSKRY